MTQVHVRPVHLWSNLLALIMSFVLTSTSQAQLANTKITFETNRNGSFEIYVMNADGTNQTRLTNNTANDNTSSWSPDGTKIVFDSVRDGNSEIYVMNADGTNQTRLTNNPAVDAVSAWSPDGTKIAFSSNRDGNYEIYVMNADGTNQTRLTNTPADFSWPAWSPDGTKIAFADGSGEIYVMNADGTNQTQLTTNPEDDSEPSWSPDGTKIVFTSIRSGNFEVYVMNADGTAQTAISNHPAYDGGRPSWSPDGMKIAFASERDGNREVYVMNADGTNPIRLTDNPASDRLPAWSPFLPTTFTDVGASAGVNDSQNGYGVAWGDYDNDGDLDLYVANTDEGANRLYQNNGNGTFTEVGASAGVNDSGNSVSAVWGDYDNDGELDLYITNAFPLPFSVNRLYRNNGNGTFAEVGANAGVNDNGDGRGAAWSDYNNDGYLDLYVANTIDVQKKK